MDSHDRNTPATHRVAGNPVLRAADALSGLACRAGDVMLVAIMLMLVYEVTARYVFLAPTRWTQTVSTTLMIWLTFLAMAMSLRNRHMIRITTLLGNASPMMRRVAEAFSLIVIGGFAVLAFALCLDAMIESYNTGRRQPTMLRMPNWIAELPIVAGFALLALQALADLIRLPFRPAPEFIGAPEQELASTEAGLEK